MLYQVCKKLNPQSYFVEKADELNREWFENANSTGITGSASTPLWQIENIKRALTTILT
jgi:4-hydroxy-3-methylbut-2-enyl diphosphate reductase